MSYNTIKPLLAVAALLWTLGGGGAGCREEQGPTGGAKPVTVVCGAELELGPADAKPADWADTPRPWTLARASGSDLITITRSGSCGDECAFVEELVLAPGTGSCPDFVSARRITADHGSALGVARDTVEARGGTLAIQDWSPPRGPLSGRLTGDLELTFYVAADD